MLKNKIEQKYGRNYVAISGDVWRSIGGAATHTHKRCIPIK